MNAPPVVLGGGVAGGYAACALALAGEAAILIERQAGPAHKVCGEFISAEAARRLASIGVDLAALGARAVTSLRLVHKARSAEIALPVAGASLRRIVLDEALLARAAALGVAVRRGVAARALGPDGTLGLDDGTTPRPRALFLATGKHDLRGAGRPRDDTEASLVGFKMYFRLSPAQTASLAGAVELVWFRGGYAGLQLVEDGTANLCLLVARARLAETGGWDGLLTALAGESAHLACRLDGAEPMLARPLAIAGVPYGFLHAAGQPDWLYRLGDQAAVIHSLSGDGMAIALESAARAVACYRAGIGGAGFAGRLRQAARRPVMVAGLVARAGRWMPAGLVAVGRLAPSVVRLGVGATRIA